MRLVVLGGTVFLSQAIAVEAVARGHEVVCVCRGESGAVPDGARLVRWDRATEPAPLSAIGPVDAVVDVARHPSRVRAAVEAFPDAHWVFVSTISVYPDTATPGAIPTTSALHEPIVDDIDLDVDPEAYGPMKVACEQAVLAGAASSTVIRPGLISGPGDPSGRFTYWPERLAAGGEVLSGGEPDDVVQIIDVRDLATWVVTAAERRTTGCFDGIGAPVAFAELLSEIAAGVGAAPTITWVPSAFLREHGVDPWAGPQGLPLWLPRPEYDGMLARDPAPSFDAALTTRPVRETARDTLAWLTQDPDAARTGLSRQREVDVLAAWRERS